MKNLIASHNRNIYLKPGEAFVAKKPTLISTVLGSCVAVTIFSPDCGVGAICHAMLPDSAGCSDDLRYVDNALHYIYNKTLQYGGAGSALVVKLFGGAKVLNTGNTESSMLTIGEQNIARALEIISALGLTVTSADTGGMTGRRVYFCTRDGDVYVRKVRRSC